MPNLLGILETALYVDAFERACPFYEQVLGLNSIFRDARLCAYDVGGRGVLLLFLRGASLDTMHMPGGTIPPHDGHGPVHMALSIAADELAAWEALLKDADIEIEGRTKWPRGGESIYFRDPDGHLLELATPACGRDIKTPSYIRVRSLFAQESKPGANLLRKNLGRFPSGEVPALIKAVVMDEFRIRPLRPTSRSWIKLA